ncbi:MAG: formate-dependent phosphoribosylglycinamide formyltransferase [Helicobacteraceae bacterium]|jgi:phosphoribosylglycinamide formyltransferase 2|nr:formate-dependent phosphoribosylglycinamide formyltransferase [Helicobacteraceae bacterium]
MDFGAPYKSQSVKIMLLGGGELGKEVAIEASRLGLEVIAVDRYANAPAHLVANKAYTIDLKDKSQILEIIRREKPSYILPEIEAISIDALLDAEAEGFNVIPNARAAQLTMNRKGIRIFAAEELGLKTSAYRFVKNYDELAQAAEAIGFPCVIKPVMSSSGHGQSVAKSADDLKQSFALAQEEARGDASELIVEEFIHFDFEITLLTVRTEKETRFCPPIGHAQRDGDYIYSWQPIALSETAREKAETIAKRVTDALGGRGIFGVELFVKGEEVYFSEVSPRPHDTGMVTLITQNQSEFALHIRAVLGLPIGFSLITPGASAAYKAQNESSDPVLEIPDSVFTDRSFARIFGKPISRKGRRLAVVLAADSTAEKALQTARTLVAQIKDR